MEKYKYLLKNVGIMTLASFGTKILSFLMVPLYTNILSTEAYGTYDIYQTTLFLIVPVLSLNIADGIMRFSLDETYDKREVFMVGVRRYIVACVLCILLVGVNQCFSIIETLTLYPQFFVLYFVTSLMSDVLNNYARGIEKVSDVAIGGIIGSVSMLTLNVLFLLVFKWGLVGYFVANCLSFASTDLYLLIKLKIWKVISWKPENRSLKKEMVIGDRIASICSSHNVTVDYAFQDINDIPGTLPEGRTKPWGTGQAVLAAKDVIKTPFIVINADDYYGKESFKAVHEYLVNGGKSCIHLFGKH